MIIEGLEELYRAEAKANNDKPHSPFRASRAGHCVAALARDKLGHKGDPVQPRRQAVFNHGTIIHDALTTDLALAHGSRFIHPKEFGELSVEIEGCTVTLHPDGGFHTPDNRIAVVELKTMSDFAFDRAVKGQIEREYLAQAWVYHLATSFQMVVFIAYRKETSAMVEIIFDIDQPELVVTQRFGGDPLTLAKEDPLAVTEIRSPFDGSVDAEVKETYRILANVHTDDDIPEGVMAIEPELVKVQGKEKAAPLFEKYGEPLEVKAGGWHTFATGRRIATFPCSYCSHLPACLGAKLEFNGNKPIWVIG